MSYVCFLCSGDVYEAEKKSFEGKTFHGVCFGSWKKHFLEKENADLRNAEYYKIPDVSPTKIRESNYNTGTQPNSTYMLSVSSQYNSGSPPSTISPLGHSSGSIPQVSTAPSALYLAATANSNPTGSQSIPTTATTAATTSSSSSWAILTPSAPPLSAVSAPSVLSVPDLPSSDSVLASHSIPYSASSLPNPSIPSNSPPSTPVVQHESQVAKVTKEAQVTKEAEAEAAGIVASSVTPPRRWRPRSQSVTSPTSRPAYSPPEHATITATSLLTDSKESKISPKIPPRPPVSVAKSPKSIPRAPWPKPHATAFETTPTMPPIPEHTASPWRTSLLLSSVKSEKRNKPRCASLPVHRSATTLTNTPLPPESSNRPSSPQGYPQSTTEPTTYSTKTEEATKLSADSGSCDQRIKEKTETEIAQVDDLELDITNTDTSLYVVHVIKPDAPISTEHPLSVSSINSDSNIET